MINIALTVMAAYPLSRRDLVGRNFVMFFYSFTMFFGGGIIPLYLLVRSLGMVNTRWAMLIPNAMAVWNVILTRTYFQSSIPHELLESSQIDGCSNSRFVWSIVLPLSKPIVAVISLFYGVMHWNTFFHALIFLKDSDLYPLQIVLREILIQNQMDNTMMMDIEQQQHREMLAALLKYSLIIVASVPVLLIYPFVQKYFVKGVMIGAIKG
jgi:multiple sugar transport system permease protein/putative aldouronate transport system permease protein